MSHPVFEGNSAYPTSGTTAPPPALQYLHTQNQRNESPLPNLQGRATDALPPSLHRTTHGDILTTTSLYGKHPLLTPSHQPQNSTAELSHRPLSQLDGSQDHRPRMHTYPLPIPTQPRGPPASSNHPPAKSAYRDLLPYCTADTPLTEQQVIALSDIAGSLREVVVLAVRARTDEGVAEVLAGAVGEAGMRGVVEFFEEEFEV
ncbi:hypothetical protein P171DRAFT_487400 [Karstenula rhodostoma CBS 690.94]|uniref:Uncharacterized protein n=1 Tax=Karstenula rhodostoma CBS 690.94 TaxID=1392251 RepID=A0A9P4U9G1_9PLEO|nr:hypothetical protein P171DRAFT_487400 [Karstenula rhodostoma CBS 690.94]